MSFYEFPRKSEVPEAFTAQLREPRRARILIGGEIRTSGFALRKVTSPCALLNDAGQPEFPLLGESADVTPEQFLEAVQAAKRAWAQGRGEWPTARMEERITAVIALRNAIAKRRDAIAKLLMWEIAKTWPEAQAEFDRTIQYIDDTIEAVKQLDRDSSRVQFAGGIIAQIRRSPLGVTLCMGPFNYPFNETFTTLIPALILGNCLVVKGPRWGQMLWDELLEPFRDTLPPGVINFVNGAGRNIIAPAVKSGDIDVLAFIGSSPVANQIKLSHPRPHRFRSVLSLDAKNPAVILPDADLKVTVDECLKGALSYNGQRCTALKILFVHRSISKAFVSAFAERVDGLKVGQPWEAGVSITPLPDPKKPAALAEMIAEAVKGGARLANPGRGGKTHLSLMAPAVIAGVPIASRLALEEQFGPVVPIVEYDRVEEFEDYVEHSHFGMQASVFGQDTPLIARLIDELTNQVCRINLNSQCQRGPDVFPFTGRKGSAEGTLSVTDALRQFSIRTMVAAKQDADGKKIFRSILESDASDFLNTNVIL